MHFQANLHFQVYSDSVWSIQCLDVTLLSGQDSKHICTHPVRTHATDLKAYFAMTKPILYCLLQNVVAGKNH